MRNGQVDTRVVLTGFMGVGKTSVARHLSTMLDRHRTDLDTAIEVAQGRTIPQILDEVGEPAFREIETKTLKAVLVDDNWAILSLGGGTWTIPENRELIRSKGLTTVWLESTFDHCWLNIRHSRKERPLARNKAKALKLFHDRQKVYCLADWHFIIRPDLTSYDVAREIAEQVFLINQY
jgi:shikimate kinase